MGIIGFGIQIYGDFSGYSDIAIGAALILGFKLPINFNKPYFATSPSDFWRKWHISLSTWLRDYLYIPLGGNKKSRTQTFVNLLLVMVLGGLWHGASINFIIWGVLHGGYLAIHRAITNKFNYLKIHLFFKIRVGKIISILITQYLVFLAWIPFRVQNVDHMFYSMQKYILLDFQFSGVIGTILEYKIPVILIVLFVILNYISFQRPNLIEKIANLKIYFWGIVLLFIMLSVLFLLDENQQQFIYFRF